MGRDIAELKLSCVQYMGTQPRHERLPCVVSAALRSRLSGLDLAFFQIKAVDHGLLDAEGLLIFRGWRRLADSDQYTFVTLPSDHGRIELAILSENMLEGIGKREFLHFRCIGVKKQSGF